MEQSILKSTKKNLGLDPDDPSFDVDVITHINATFSTLTQLGVGPTVFMIEDGQVNWPDYLDDDVLLGLVKTYTYLKVRMLFDPPTISYLKDAFESQIAQFEWRISVYRESLEWTDPEAATVDG